MATTSAARGNRILYDFGSALEMIRRGVERMIAAGGCSTIVAIVIGPNALSPGLCRWLPRHVVHEAGSRR